MELKHYELFVSMAETGNLTRTAESFGYTQSAVSHILRHMEEELGFALFVRSKRGVSLTANGALMLPYVRRLLKSSQNLQQMLSQIQGIQRGRITIGAFVSVSMYWMPRLISRFQKQYPHIRVEIKEGSLDDLEHWLDAGLLDMAFMSYVPERKRDWISLQKDELLLVTPTDFSARERELFSLQDLKEHALILMTDSASNDIRQLVQSHGLMDRVRYTTTNAYTMIAMVEAHLGLTILPRLITDSIDADYHMIKTYSFSPRCYRSLGIAVPDQTQLSPAAQEFIRYAQAAL